MGKLGWGERPADALISIPDFLSCSDTAAETYNLGTFAVVEREQTGFSLILR